MRFLILLSLVVPFCGCAGVGGFVPLSADANRQTLTKGVLKRDVQRRLAAVEWKWHAECPDPQIVKITLAEAPSEADRRDRVLTGGFKEHWTVDRCGKKIVYEVSFRPGSDGGITFSLQPLDGE